MKTDFLTPHFTIRELNPHGFPITQTQRFNLLQLALFLELVRTRYGFPIKVNSGYRTPEFNRSVGGVVNSQHINCKAVDITVSHVSYDLAPDRFDDCFKRLQFAVFTKMPDSAQRFVKIYSAKRFIHVHFGTRDSAPLDLFPYLPFADLASQVVPDAPKIQLDPVKTENYINSVSNELPLIFD